MATNAHTQPQQQQQNVGVPYIGSKISLISKKDIRYEGILFNIDTKEASVALQTVRSFGTEGRRPLHENVPPSDTVFDYVIFRGADIKDLHVCEAPQQSLPDDPAIISSQTAPAPPQQVSPAAGSLPTPPPSASTLGTNSPNSLSASAAVAPQSTTRDPNYGVQDAEEDMKTMNLDGNADGRNSRGGQRRRGGRAGGQQNSGSRAARTIPGMGNHLLGRRERGVKEEKAPEECTHEFDFEERLGEFDKEKEYSILNTEETSSTKQNMAYNKSSFFDNISCDALDRLEGNSGRMRASEERKLNTETFGAIGLNNRRNYRGRGRGYRNRGGRRGGRGYRGGRGGRGGSRDNLGRDDQGGRSLSHD